METAPSFLQPATLAGTLYNHNTFWVAAESIELFKEQQK